MNTNTKDPQGRRWQITINNPEKWSLDHDRIKYLLNSIKSKLYFCMADEIGLEEKTHHTHIYLVTRSSIRFSTLKKKFPSAHIVKAYGTSSENRDYIGKTGKWADDPKSDTAIAGTFEEWGELPAEVGQGFRSDIALLYGLIADGNSNAEIMKHYPDLAIHINRMDKIRQDILENEYREVFRELNVTYIFGPTETGKTRRVMEEHGYGNVYRVTDYDHPFDRYASENVMLFDEFRSSIRIQDMLMYLEGYPINLPARYSQRVACYTEVYIISNIDLKEQYRNVQQYEPATWNAFIRRINKVIEYSTHKRPIDHGTAYEYINGKKFNNNTEWVETDTDELPF